MSRNLTPRKFLALVAAAVVIASGAWLLWNNSKAMAPDSSVSSPPVTGIVADEKPTGTSETFTGEYMCLPHTNTSGPTTMECAFGLKGNDGKYYALRDTSADYHLIGNLATGTRVTVTGVLTPETSDTYPITGTIAVTAVQ